jgi:hypothetical protein
MAVESPKVIEQYDSGTLYIPSRVKFVKKDIALFSTTLHQFEKLSCPAFSDRAGQPSR